VALVLHSPHHQEVETRQEAFISLSLTWILEHEGRLQAQAEGEGIDVRNLNRDGEVGEAPLEDLLAHRSLERLQYAARRLRHKLADLPDNLLCVASHGEVWGTQLEPQKAHNLLE